jgi:hypothetical protein
MCSKQLLISFLSRECPTRDSFVIIQLRAGALQVLRMHGNCCKIYAKYLEFLVENVVLFALKSIENN